MTSRSLVAFLAGSATAFAIGSCSGGDGEAVGGGGTHGYHGDASTTDSKPSDSSIINFDGMNTDSTTSWDNFNPEAGCASSSVSATQTPANILFLIDKTGSMNCNPPPTMLTADCEKKPQTLDPTVPSKWGITRDALKGALLQLQKTSPLPSAGIAYFNNGDFCSYAETPNVDIMPLNDNQVTALGGSLDLVDPWGATPIVGALMRAWAYLQKNSAQFEGNKFVVLLTDGGESCDPNAMPLAVEKAKEAYAIGIRTFVLGAPGSEDYRAFLSQLAFNGGTWSSPTCDHSGTSPEVGDCHMDMTQPNTDFAAELAKNLKAISSQALSCEFDVPPPQDGGKVDPAKVNVNYTPGAGGNPVVIPRNDNLACNDPQNNGWQYSADNSKIVLCGSACQAVKADSQAKVSIVLGCETHTVPK